MMTQKMSDNAIPNLSQYFGSSETSESFSNQLQEAANEIQNLKINEGQSSSICKKESELSKLFAHVLVPKDPTASFFDVIGISQMNTIQNGVGIISDLSLSTNDDGYIARVAIGTEADRRRDAWIPSENTRQCLIACATAIPGSYVPDKDILTMPGVVLEEEMGDAVGEAVSICLGEAEAAQRRALTASDVTYDERGLRELIEAGAYRAAINLTAQLLAIYGQGRGRIGHVSKHSPHSLQLWFTRIALLIKTKTFNIASAEAETFGQLDKPDLYYQFYPEMYGSRPGSIASFSFRLLLAELPMHCGKPKESLTRLFAVLAIVQQIIKNLNHGLCEDGNPMKISDSDRNDSLRLWGGREVRVLHSVVNCGLVVKDYNLAMDILGKLCERDFSPKTAILSALGRLRLQFGDISGAEGCFNEACQATGRQLGVRELVDKGLLAIAQNEFQEGYIYFQKANQLEPSNIMILNNMGVCLLYGGRLKEAIKVLETAVSLNPVHALQESLLLNLCTLYDMESSKGRKKKFGLLKQISRYQADVPTTILEKLYG